MVLHWLTRLVNGVSDEGLHRRFVKYSVGVFDGPRLEVIFKGRNLTLRGDFGYEDFIGWFALSLMDENEECGVNGVVFGNMCAEVFSGYGGQVKVKGETYSIKVNFSSKAGKLREIYERYADRCNLLLSIKAAGGWSVKCKTRLDWKTTVRENEEEKIDFCIGKLQLKEEGFIGRMLLESVAPDFLNKVPQKFYRMLIINEFVVERLVPPEGEGFSARELRLLSKRQGKIKRVLNVDGEILHNEVDFLV